MARIAKALMLVLAAALVGFFTAYNKISEGYAPNDAVKEQPRPLVAGLREVRPNRLLVSWPTADSGASFIPPQVKFREGEAMTYIMPTGNTSAWIRRGFESVGLVSVGANQGRTADIAWNVFNGITKQIYDGTDPYLDTSYKHTNTRPMATSISNALGRADGTFSKTGMINNLAKIAKDFGCSSYQLELGIPITLPFDSRSACEEIFSRKLEAWGSWLLKPCCLAKGKGMFIISPSQFRDLVKTKAAFPDFCSVFDPPGIMDGVLQQFIDRPFLWNNRRFHIRSYVLLASTVPFVLLQHPGYIRLSRQQFSSRLDSQLTNVESATADDVATWDRFNEFLRETGVGENVVGDILEPEMIKLTRNLFSMALLPRIFRTPGSFRLMAIDWLLDEDLNLFLLEVNTSPGSTRDDGNLEVDENEAKKFHSLFEIVIKLQSKGMRRQSLEDPEVTSDWKLILAEPDARDSKYGWQTTSSVTRGCKGKKPRGVTVTTSVPQRQTGPTCVEGENCFYGFCENDVCRCLYFGRGPCCLARTQLETVPCGRPLTPNPISDEVDIAEAREN